MFLGNAAAEPEERRHDRDDPDCGEQEQRPERRLQHRPHAEDDQEQDEEHDPDHGYVLARSGGG